MSGKGLFLCSDRPQTNELSIYETTEKEMGQLKKKKVAFEELLKENRRELLEDQKLLEKIDERIEARRLAQKSGNAS
jgi:hypothetical protein